MLLTLLVACALVTGNEHEARFDVDGDNVAWPDDCDDSDAGVFPGADEIFYDGIDQNCDGANDYDQDGDGVDWLDGGGADCDDLDADVYPGAPDAWYDGVDSDCAGDSDYDQDGDGHDSPADCDDEDAAIYPGAADVWYDGVDSDCADNSDYDQDGDGHDDPSNPEGGGDCNDGDSDIHPGLSETWYDGIDKNCDGQSDYDQDGDGHDSVDYGGDDCADTLAGTYPGAVDEWYDGIDRNCDGADDYDQDGDGHASLLEKPLDGDDCNDYDPTISPSALEHLSDFVDTDCDGGHDTSPFRPLDVRSATGLRGPDLQRLGAGNVVLSVMTESHKDAEDNGRRAGAIWYELAPDAALDGVVAWHEWSYDDLAFPTTKLSDEKSFALYGDEDFLIWAFSTSFNAGSERFFEWVTYDMGADLLANDFVLKVASDSDYHDVEMAVDASGLVEFVACDADNAEMFVSSGTPDDYMDTTGVSRDQVDGVDAFATDACLLWPNADWLMASNRPGNAMQYWNYQAGMTFDVEESPWNVYDMAIATDDQFTLLGFAEGAASGYIYREDNNTFANTDAVLGTGHFIEVDVALGPASENYIALLDQDTGQVTLKYGDLAALRTVVFEPDDVDEVSILAADDLIYLAIRRGETAEYTVLGGY